MTEPQYQNELVVKLPFGIIEVIKVITSRKTGDWCQIPYPNHPKGCPKYGDRNCPPNAPFITEIMDLSRPVYIAFSEFDLHEHIEKMRAKLPDWSERQLKCVLYWQGTSRKQMRERAKMARFLTGADVVLTCPEGNGVNVYATCFVVGLRLQKIKDIAICRHIALVGYSCKYGDTRKGFFY